MSVTKPIPASTWMAWWAQWVAASEAQSLAMAAALVKSSPWSLRRQARQVTASSRHAMPLSFSWMA
eukprot:CAMPEP_0181268504 /NCGR_PEP_ID=MMETSP1097-20121128/5566_1 /TAXON_ID=35684 /ORGANISM="Pseudopedinella elastica, Strain CCMP716" /LENGTH=65 /DNA_ID=CAMNT_0023368197 /DNA_START=340 /DNA_END=537 /DNA_ORIENTATION=+